jgi:hypothetical protein
LCFPTIIPLAQTRHLHRPNIPIVNTLIYGELPKRDCSQEHLPLPAKQSSEMVKPARKEILDDDDAL